MNTLQETGPVEGLGGEKHQEDILSDMSVPSERLSLEVSADTMSFIVPCRETQTPWWRAFSGMIDVGKKSISQKRDPEEEYIALKWNKVLCWIELYT